MCDSALYQSRVSRPSRLSHALALAARDQIDIVESEMMWLCHEMGGEEHVLEPVSAKDDLIVSGKLIDAIEDLVPSVLRHETDERIQTNDSLLTEMVENSCGENIGIRMLT
jgi:hypothetical protein